MLYEVITLLASIKATMQEDISVLVPQKAGGFRYQAKTDALSVPEEQFAGLPAVSYNFV